MMELLAKVFLINTELMQKFRYKGTPHDTKQGVDGKLDMKEHYIMENKLMEMKINYI